MNTHTISRLYYYRILYDELCEPVGVEFQRCAGRARKHVVMFDDHETCFDYASMSYDGFFSKYERGKPVRLLRAKRRVVEKFLRIVCPLLFRQARKVTI